MHADHVAVSWDADKHNWLVRIEVGSEVIRRHCKYSKDTDEETLRDAAEKTVIDEGFEVDKALISVVRP